MEDKLNSKSYVAAILQAVTVGFSFLAIKIALNSADALYILANRFSIAIIAGLVVYILGYGGEKLSIQDFKNIIPYGLIYPISMFFFQTVGMKYVSSSESGIINALAPIATFIIATIILHESITLKQIFFIIVSVVGVIFINCINGLNTANYNLFGISMIVISVISMAFYSVFIRKISSHYSSFNISLVLNFVGFVFFNILSISNHLINKNISGFFTPFTNVNYILSLLFLGICCSLFTAILNAYALKSIPAITIGLLNNLSTIVSILAGVLILKEDFNWYHLVGIIIVLIGTVGFNFAKNKEVKE